jgi:glycosyltransferase involved in cell wall biosynthesis
VARALIIAYTTYIHDGRVKRHAEALAERGDHVDVISLDQAGVLNRVNILGLGIRRYRGASRTSYVGNYVRFFARASAVAMHMSLNNRYDLAIACTMPDAAVLSTVPLRLLGSKVILDVHDTMPELYRDKFGGRRGALGARMLMVEERLSAACAHRVLAVHEPHRQRLIQSGIAASKIHVVMNSPDSKIFRPEAIQAGRDPHFTVICHGTLTRRLGLDVAIKAVALLKDRIPELRLRIVGDGDYRISITDPVPIEKLPQLLQEASVGLVPNRPSSATHLMLPVKLLEYTALGIPSIAPRLRTIQRYFDCDSVRYFEPGNEISLANAIADLFHDCELRHCITMRGQAVARRISWSSQRTRFYEAVDSLLAERRTASSPSPQDDRQPQVPESSSTIAKRSTDYGAD